MKFIAIASEFMSETQLEQIIDQHREALEKKGYERITHAESLNYDKVAYFVITGGTENQILQHEINRDETSELVLISHPKNNSLPACLEALSRFIQFGRPGRIDILGSDQIISSKNTIKPFACDLKGARIGVIGEPSDWLVASRHSAEIVAESTNSKLIPISMVEFIGAYHSASEANLEIKTDLVKSATEIIEPSDDDIEKNIRVYLAIKNLIEIYDLQAVTIRCFDIVKVFQTTGCFALSKLNDEGLIAGCEGDIPSIVAMLWRYRSSGKIPWMANPSQVNVENNSIELAHCTVPRSLVNSYRLRSHFETNLGVGIQGYFPTNMSVSLFRIGGEDLDKIWQAKGVILSHGNDGNLCRTQITIKLTEGDVAELLTNPLGNHIIIEID